MIFFQNIGGLKYIIYTNKYKLPDYVCHYLKFDEYDYEDGVISTTRLLTPPRSFALTQRNLNDLSCDVSEVISAKYGTAIHASIEKSNIPNSVQEKRLYATVLGTRISGKPDLLLLPEHDNGESVIIDIKSTSVWTFIKGSKLDDYRLQVSIYRWLAEQNGVSVSNKGKIWYIFTDWSKTDAANDPNYPQTRMVVQDIDLIELSDIELWLNDRIRLFNSCTAMPEQELPDCTDDELWVAGTKYAVYKENGKRAIRLFDTMQEASQKVLELGESYHVEERLGIAKRCSYCLARKFCRQYKQLAVENRAEAVDQIDVA